jgi:hypothetical protein
MMKCFSVATHSSLGHFRDDELMRCYYVGDGVQLIHRLRDRWFLHCASLRHYLQPLLFRFLVPHCQ